MKSRKMSRRHARAARSGREPLQTLCLDTPSARDAVSLVADARSAPPMQGLQADPQTAEGRAAGFDGGIGRVTHRPVRSSAGSNCRLVQGCATGVVAFSMAGCSLQPPLGPVDSAGSAPEPFLRIRGQQLDAPQAYAMGKAALGVGDPQRALLHFEKALSISPQMADAENGRVVALARLGRVDEAISLGQRAVALGTSSAELHGNLGLLLDERGDSRRAAIHLARAAQLDPSNPAWQRWTMAEAVSAPVVTLDSAGRPTPAPLTQATQVVERAGAAGGDAEGLRWVQQSPNVLALASSPAGRTTGTTLAAAGPSTAPPAVIVLGSSAPAVAASTRPAATANAAMSPSPATPTATARNVASAAPAAVLEASLTVLSRVEISNGHGRKGLAREVASALQPVMSGPARVTNHTHFRVLQTEVQYRSAEDRGAAQTLARSLGVPQERIVPNARLHESAPLRLLLGRDAPDTQEAITDTLARARRNLPG